MKKHICIPLKYRLIIVFSWCFTMLHDVAWIHVSGEHISKRKSMTFHDHKHWPVGWFLATKHPWSTPWNSTCNPWYKCQGSIGQPTPTNVHDLFLLLSARFQIVITLSLWECSKRIKGQNRWLSSSCKFSRIQHFAKTGACIKKRIPQSGNQPWEIPPFSSMLFPMSMPIYRDFPASHVWLSIVAALWAAGTVQGPRSWLSRLPRWPGR